LVRKRNSQPSSVPGEYQFALDELLLVRDDWSDHMRVRGYSLLELLISTAIILVLMIAVGSALVGTLHLQFMHADRAGMSRSASELAARLSEEARSSTAVFIPSTDVSGNPNGGSQGDHEVDFLRRLSAGGNAFVAYSFDSSAGTVTRYDYSDSSGDKTILDSDLVAGDIATFSVSRESVASTGTTVGQTDPASVTIFYGTPELMGGNDVIVANISAKASSGIPDRLYVIHLASRAAPTSLAILAPKAPPSSPPPTKIIPFVILRRGFPTSIPHGPIHGGSPGGPATLIHWVAGSGSIEFLSPGGLGAINWFDFSSAFYAVSSGTYTFTLANGSLATASIACAGGACPSFRPNPVSAPGFAPQEGVAFELISQ
jgi:type II secretory pathway pseudopilin PulG